MKAFSTHFQKHLIIIKILINTLCAGEAVNNWENVA